MKPSASFWTVGKHGIGFRPKCRSTAGSQNPQKDLGPPAGLYHDEAQVRPRTGVPTHDLKMVHVSQENQPYI